MERFNAQPTKRKIKKEPTPSSNHNEGPVKKLCLNKETEEINGPSSKDYVSVSAETISVIAESIGVSNIGDDIAANLAEDVSYKLLEIINASCTIMHKSKRRKLLSSDVNTALRLSDVNHIFGHSQREPFRFLRLPEGELYVAEDTEVDLISLATSDNVPKVKKPSYITTSYPILRNMFTPPINGHSAKTEGRSFPFLHIKSEAVNGDVKVEASSFNSYSEIPYLLSSKYLVKQNNQSPDHVKRKTNVPNGPHMRSELDSRSKLNGRVKFAHHYGIREKLKRNSEEELKFSRAQLSFFNIVTKCIIEGHHCLFRQALSSLRHSKKADTIATPLLNFVALSVCHIPRHFGFLSRLLETVDVLLCNVYINPTYTIAINRLVNALLAITADQNVLRGKNDFLLRRKAAHLLTRVLLVWGIEEQHSSELLSRVARVLSDPKEKIQSHFGALVIFQSLGKAALSWLSPLLKSYLPLLEKRFPPTSVLSNIQVEEIRGTLLDIVEFLFCDASSYRFKIKASTIQELQAMIQLDSLLYQYCGDAVCARRRPFFFQFRGSRKKQGHPEKFQKARTDSRAKQHGHNLRYISYCPQKQKQHSSTSEVFEEVCVSPFVRRKDIQFKFAGANPVPKDGLRKKVLDKAHVLFKSVSNNQLFPSTFPKQHLLVGHMPQSRFKGSGRHPYTLNSLFSVL